MQKHGTCIFCGGLGLTKEHVWPDWLRNVIVSTTKRSAHIVDGMVQLSPRSIYIIDETKFGKQNRTGAITSRKLRVVCIKCNNNWMSNLQTKAKFLLVPMIKDRKWSISSEEDTKIIASWITMFTIVSEYLNPDRVTTTEAERRLFRNTVNPLSSWNIWLGYHAGRVKEGQKINHGSIRHSNLARFPLNKTYKMDYNEIGITTALCGDLLFQSHNTRLENTKLDTKLWAYSNGLVLIHPFISNIDGVIKTFNDDDFEGLHLRLAEYAKQSRPPFNEHLPKLSS